MKDGTFRDYRGYLELVRKLVKGKRYAKGFSFGKEPFAVDKEDRLKMPYPLSSDSFVLHKCRYEVYCKLNRKVMPTLESLKEYLHIIGFNAELEESTCRNYSSRQEVVTLCGYGLSSLHVRALLHRKVSIVRIVATRLEVKCYPSKAFLDTDELKEIELFPPAPKLPNREDIYTIAYCYYGDYIISIYDIEEPVVPNPFYISFRSWGLNFEVISNVEIPESEFHKTVNDICCTFTRFAGSHIRPVSSLKTGEGCKPSGLLVESISRRNKSAIPTILSSVLSHLHSNSYLLHSDFVSMFSHLSSLKSRQNAVSHYAKQWHLDFFYLSPSKLYENKAWRRK